MQAQGFLQVPGKIPVFVISLDSLILLFCLTHQFYYYIHSLIPQHNLNVKHIFEHSRLGFGAVPKSIAIL